MENPEEVLQALDEFQKMRPSEIPRELEDYLCWVAKTGDPVYQWSLVKALFREKLMRVITEFYETCPSLDLTPCPNVEPFNYDIMKRNLLERLENFTNAPFTVQRICELLTSPRKEYNRFDKFMRAIEKNILVVSTKEPGQYGRLSENGDNLVNGSVEDESSRHETASNEVDMENWVKDYTTATSVPVLAEHNVDMTSENGLKDRTEAQATASSFVNSSADYSAATVTSQDPSTETPSALSSISSHESSGIMGDVSDAIMNEDTSSQPSLELESDDNDSNDSKKLQTTFQAKDFTAEEDAHSKTYAEALKQDKTDESLEINEASKECDQLIEKLSNESSDDAQEPEKLDELEVNSAPSEIETDKLIVTEQQDSEKNESELESCVDNLTSITDSLDAKNDILGSNTIDAVDDTTEVSHDTEVEHESKAEIIEDITASVTEKSEDEASEILSEVIEEPSKPIVEEPRVEMTEPVVEKEPDLTIEETLEEDTNAKLIVPDPIPIIEEPKDSEPASKDWENSLSVDEIATEAKDADPTVENGLNELSTKSDSDDNKITEGVPSNEATMETMDIDNEVQQEEPMEQEAAEAMNS